MPSIVGRRAAVAPPGPAACRAAAGCAGGPRCTDACGARKSSRTGALLDDAAGVHDDDVLGDLGDDAEIVGDEDDAHPSFSCELAEQLEDLRLDGDVERGRRLVGDEQLGSHASAIAIITRWRMPPESWCG